MNHRHNDDTLNPEPRGRSLFCRALAGLLLLCLFISGACAPQADYFREGIPIEPLVAGEYESITEGDLVVRGRFAVVNPEMTVYALDISSDGRRILFSSDACTVSLIDDQGRLQWDLALDNAPTSAALSSDGRFIAVGTDQGEIIFLRQDGREQWRTAVQGAIKKLEIAPGGENLAVSVQNEEEEHLLYFYDAWGSRLHELQTSELKEIVFLPRGNFAYLEKQDGKSVVVLYQDGLPYWEEEVSQAAFAGNGRYVAVSAAGELHFLELTGETQPHTLWSKQLELEPSWMQLTEMGGHVILYSGFSGSKSNLFVYDRLGKLTWEKRIPAGALMQASRFGERIVASSWQEYSEDFSKLLVLDIKGHILQDVEMASRIEKLALSGDGKVLGLASSDGDIFIFELPVLGSFPLERETAAAENGFHYSPAAREQPPGEMYVTLYFYDQDALHLIPVNRPVQQNTAALKTAIDELIKGPRRGSNLLRTVPKDSRIEVTREEDLVYIDLPEDLDRAFGSVQATGIINSLLYTASQFSYVRGIKFLIEGEEADYFGTEGLLIDEVLQPQTIGQEKDLIFVPYRSAGRYYLLPRESLQLGERSNIPRDLVNAIVKESERFLPVKPGLLEARLLPGEIVLDWDKTFQEIFPSDGSAADVALAHLFVDAVTLTLTSRFSPERLIFKVEGRSWNPPEKYPDLVQELTSPFYINPE